MNFSTQLDNIHARVKSNKWMRYFTIFTRVALAAGFLPAGYVKIIGERFTDLHNNQPMGHYLEALHHTGFYYTFIGYAQIVAAILVLIPRTVVLGVFLYLPIIFNIFMLSWATRFEGSAFTSPLMVMACLFLLCWNYDRVKYILPFNTPPPMPTIIANNRFPFWFFGPVLATFVAVVFTVTHLYELIPRNTLKDCERQCAGAKDPDACKVFCESIHNKGQDLDKSLEVYEKTLQHNKHEK